MGVPHVPSTTPHLPSTSLTPTLPSYCSWWIPILKLGDAIHALPALLRTHIYLPVALLLYFTGDPQDITKHALVIIQVGPGVNPQPNPHRLLEYVSCPLVHLMPDYIELRHPASSPSLAQRSEDGRVQLCPIFHEPAVSRLGINVEGVREEEADAHVVAQVVQEMQHSSARLLRQLV